MTTLSIHLYEVCAGVFFLVWLALTVSCQFEHHTVTQFVRTFDVLNLIPIWTFFAPNPGKQDYHLLYRDKTRGDAVGDWIEVDLQEERHLLSCLWNPDKRDKKVLSDVVQDLITLLQAGAGQTDNRFLVLTLPYLTILKAVCIRERRRPEAACRQFMLAGSHGFNSGKDPDFILLSLFHPL